MRWGRERSQARDGFALRLKKSDFTLKAASPLQDGDELRRDVRGDDDLGERSRGLFVGTECRARCESH